MLVRATRTGRGEKLCRHGPRSFADRKSIKQAVGGRQRQQQEQQGFAFRIVMAESWEDIDKQTKKSGGGLNPAAASFSFNPAVASWNPGGAAPAPAAAAAPGVCVCGSKSVEPMTVSRITRYCGPNE